MLKAFYCLFLLIAASCPSWAKPSLIEQAETLKQSLVDVKTEYNRIVPTKSGERSVRYERNGVGIILDASGIIVTNTHTIVNAPQIIVTLKNGTKLDAKVIFISNGRDFSFLKVTPPSKLKPITWADSPLAQIGDNIISIGRSEYNDNTILAGKIISLLQNNTNGIIEMIETDLNLHKGDSGGPIINKKGQLLGMIMAKNKTQDKKSIAIASDIIHKEYLQYKQSNP